MMFVEILALSVLQCLVWGVLTRDSAAFLGHCLICLQGALYFLDKNEYQFDETAFSLFWMEFYLIDLFLYRFPAKRTFYIVHHVLSILLLELYLTQGRFLSEELFPLTRLMFYTASLWELSSIVSFIAYKRNQEDTAACKLIWLVVFVGFRFILGNVSISVCSLDRFLKPL